jgi:hypothetical protein
MYRQFTIAILIMMFVSTIAACTQLSNNSKAGIQPSPTSQELPAVPGSLFFRIKQINNQDIKNGEINRWLAVYEKNGKVAKFQFELSLKNSESGSPFAFSKGVFYRESDSDSSLLLSEIAKALEAKEFASSKVRIDKLEFSVAILGMGLSREKGKDVYGGAFTSEPKGDWIATKVFVADGEGEFYLNLNPVLGIGEISIKDSDYGETVLKELSKVL